MIFSCDGAYPKETKIEIKTASILINEDSAFIWANDRFVENKTLFLKSVGKNNDSALAYYGRMQAYNAICIYLTTQIQK